MGSWCEGQRGQTVRQLLLSMTVVCNSVGPVCDQARGNRTGVAKAVWALPRLSLWSIYPISPPVKQTLPQDVSSLG